MSFQNVRLGCKSPATWHHLCLLQGIAPRPSPAGDGGGLWAPPLCPQPWAAPLTPGPSKRCSRCTHPAPEAALTWALLAQPGPCRLVSVAGALQSRHFMANPWATMETVTDFVFLAPESLLAVLGRTANSDYSHKIKRRLLLEEKQ